MARMGKMVKYEAYQSEIIQEITNCLAELQCQPILFVGTGMSKRYFQGPTWDELLMELAKQNPLIDKDFAYYKQSYATQAEIGEVFAQLYKEWAWGDGRQNFPEEYYKPDQPSSVFIKYIAAKIIKQKTPTNMDSIKNSTDKTEIELMRKIGPHAVITTNYDTLLEMIYPDFMPIIGQQIIRANYASMGEIYKIHGCVSNPTTMALTQKDYDDFMTKKKYLSAKLLTFFAEHPLLFLGYSAQDSNIRAILADIDEIITSEGSLIRNIFIVSWRETIPEGYLPKREELIPLDDGRQVRIRCIETASLEWVLRAFESTGPVDKVNPKILRALLARTYDLVRTDIPKASVQIDYATIERALSENKPMPIVGITAISDPSSINLRYPHTLTNVGQLLGYSYWHKANELLGKVKEDKGIDIKSYDNEYHVGIKIGEKTVGHKYSDRLVTLLRQVRDGESYEVT